ncbi:alpha/beta hydrolase [Virgibacillus pantothenticus]|uniref:alpha/beta hydrolase n=1 Tax=Virgibacillus pantothenticus TaxID=1473 RepID=UPI001B1DDDE4|nr:alpha/beta hydrolase [Virgibacillus pantothenticus]MBU8566832.1 alpha/beta hydrolase [Virgibacillus pantothenticus]MBU8600475.1 alpha/beta hydrolase [Virgibacillus pantothenticus]MBU8635130.1 alpha/beta hydrolase [Virgibacillus pantothenticus]MBU8642551.1 alpha/beta hydrolase [Virgibacillus pantothenticus]MBU8646762.1 alpha/beta hydrolase [Virgibacillus pantothenticus]
MLKKKIILRIGTGIIVLLVIIDIIGSFYFYHLAISRNEKDFLQENEDLEVSAEALSEMLDGNWRGWVRKQNFETWKMTSFDDLNLQGYYLPAKQETNKTVIFAHGYLGRGLDMGMFGQYYYEQLGYNMFTADLRGHGESEGDYIGFGWHDRIDYVDWINQVIEKQGKDAEIVLHGVSMGAATVLMASGEKLPDNVKAIVADSPYTSVYDMFDYQMGRMFHLPAFPLLPSTSLVSKMRAGYGLREASAVKQVKKAEVPILYIHGNADTFVPTRMSEELYDQTNSPKDLITFDGAGHGEAFVTHKENYIENLNRFLETYLPQ